MTLGLLVSGGLGYTCLFDIIKCFKVNFVMTDKGSESIIQYCRDHKIICYVGNPRNGKGRNKLGNLRCDVLLSINYLFIVEKDIISLAEKIAINFHGSLLPKYRGRTPHVWAIINNEKYTGITAHVISEHCDEGDIIYQEKIEIDDQNTGAEILQIYYERYPDIIKHVIQLVESDTVKCIKQDHCKATYFHKRTPTDARINWAWQKERIRNWVRAQARPYPGAYATYRGIQINIHKIEYDDTGFDQHEINGKVIEKINGQPIIKTNNGAIKLIDFEPPINFEVNSLFE